jgi:cytochrome c biogenesis protein CcmG/thiol:disulfide interchange protein DsbE
MSDPVNSEPEERAERRGTARTVIVSVVALALIGTLIAVFAGRLNKEAKYDESALVGRNLPPLDLPNLRGGGSLAFDDLRGSIVVINFWASWCPPCEDEHPNLLSAASAYRDRGVQFVGIVYADEPEDAARFLDRRGWGDEAGYHHVIDPGSSAAVELGVFGPPETYFVDADGAIVDKIIGGASYGDLAGRLDAILAEQSAP